MAHFNIQSPKNKSSLVGNFENLKITVSPGKTARKVNSISDETDKQIAKEVLLGNQAY